MSTVPAVRRASRIDDSTLDAPPLELDRDEPTPHLDTAPESMAAAKFRWPRAFSALQVRNYRIYVCSQLVANTGLWMQRIAQDWLIRELTGSATAVGITVACQFLPVLLFGMFGGLVADRFPKRKVLMITQSVAAALAILLGVLAVTGAVQAWHVFGIAIMLGFVTVVDNPTRQAFVSELVGHRHIRNAISLNSSVFQLGGLIGPAISGILIHAVGQGPSFMINGAACLLVVTLLGIMAVPDEISSTKSAEAYSIKEQFAEGLDYIRRTPEITWTIVLVAALALFGLNMPVILTAFATTEFSSGVGGYSLFNTLVAIGSLTGALLSARRSGGPRLRFLVSCLVGLGAALMLASVWHVEPLFCATLIGIGIVTMLFMTSANSLVQMTAPAAVRGRVMSVYLLVLLGCQAIGGPIVGSAIDHVGVRTTMLTCGAIVALVALIAGLGMARQSQLRLAVGRSTGRLAPVQIVHR
ncbi:MFS transporter [Microlunatus elymi]|nr:MFS transporter [Microlunatus elymi]